jgi:hypothetical protein
VLEAVSRAMSPGPGSLSLSSAADENSAPAGPATSPSDPHADPREEAAPAPTPKSAAGIKGVFALKATNDAAPTINAAPSSLALELDAEAADAPPPHAPVPSLSLNNLEEEDACDELRVVMPPPSLSAREASQPPSASGLNSLSARGASKNPFAVPPLSKSAPSSPTGKQSKQMSMMERQALWMEKKAAKVAAKQKLAAEAEVRASERAREGKSENRAVGARAPRERAPREH